MVQPRKQVRFWRVALNCQLSSVLLGVERNGHGRFQPRARGQEGVAQNAVHPSPKVSSELKRTESFQSLGVSFLDQIFGFFAIACKPVREVIELVEERHGQLFKGLELKIRS